jgi:hypothetical protein
MSEEKMLLAVVVVRIAPNGTQNITGTEEENLTNHDFYKINFLLNELLEEL